MDGKPIVGYDVLKDSVRLLFWSGQSFDEPGLQPEGSFKAVEARYTSPDQVNIDDLAMAGKIQNHPMGLQKHRQTPRQTGKIGYR